MDEQIRRVRQKLKDDFIHYAEKCLKISVKEVGIQPFKLNRCQRYLHEIIERQRRETSKVRCIILKGRQQGCSTYIEGRFYWLTTHHSGLRAYILTHDSTATNNLFEMAQRYHEHCHYFVRPDLEASNAKELVFSGIDSGYRVGTAGNSTVGRGSTIQLLHGSEVAFWPNADDHAKGIMQAVPNSANTEIFLESTANGIGNYFHEQWQLASKGISDFIPIFIPWYWQDEYTRILPDDFILTDEESELVRLYNISKEHLHWRRYKIIELSTGGGNGENAFKQEYPCNPVEAFQTSGEDTFISPNIVMVARKAVCERYGGLILGVDPARFGDDRTSIIRRAGRCAYNIQSYSKKDTMQVTGLVYRIIQDECPQKVCIDVGGLGAGVYDRLCELGYRDICVSVNSGSTPLDQDRYINKRAEMWGLMREWLADQPAQIPDSDTLHADLCSVKYDWDSKNRLRLEKKDDMKKRGLRSPDEADALALTFAIPNPGIVDARRVEAAKTAKDVMAGFNRIDRLKKAAYGK